MYFWRRSLNKINLKSIVRVLVQQNVQCSSAAAVDYNIYEKTQTEVVRTLVKHPKDHTMEHKGMWYTLDNEVVKRLFQLEGLRVRFKELTKIFQETAFLVREPALSVIDYIKRSNLSLPPNKFILYGRHGTGKTMSLAHIMHYLSAENWVILHVGIPALWLTTTKEVLPSITREGFYDQTTVASFWLQHFRSQNEHLLQNLELVTLESYQWTQRERTEKGSPLLSIVDFGIARSRYASDCIYCLNAELKRHAQEGRVKVGVVIDGINALFCPNSAHKSEDKVLIPTMKLTLVQAFVQMLRNDWVNGVIVGSVDVQMSTKDRRESYLPRYLLRKEGWDALDPLIPVKVNAYTDKEIENAINYYIDRMWLQNPLGVTREAKDELSFLSGKNPLELEKLVASR